MPLFAHLLSDHVKAGVIEGALVMNVPRADTPSVLRIDLRQAGAAIFAVQQAGGHHEFGFYTAREPDSQTPTSFTVLARFATRQDAENAMAAATQALLWNPHSLRRTVTRSAVWALVFGAILFMVMFTLDEINLKMQAALLTAQQKIAGAQKAGGAGDNQPQAGVPQSADQVLTPPP